MFLFVLFSEESREGKKERGGKKKGEGRGGGGEGREKKRERARGRAVLGFIIRPFYKMSLFRLPLGMWSS